MPSHIFSSGQYEQVQQAVKDFLNQQTRYLSHISLDSPRAVGDAIQSLVAQEFGKILDGLGISNSYSDDFARRSMADVAFTDKSGQYYTVDVKTHRLDTKFNMPNLTSVDRLSRLYESDTDYFVLLLINYSIVSDNINVTEVHFVPIEFLQWDCLTIGALGIGQIQIANSNVIHIAPQQTRKKWMIELFDNLLEFYPREIAKINQRIEHFKKLKQAWCDKPEV